MERASVGLAILAECIRGSRIARIYGDIDSRGWFSAANRPPDRVRRRATRGEHNSKYKITKIYSWRRNDRTCRAGFHRVQHLQYEQCMDIGCSRGRKTGGEKERETVYIHDMARRSSRASRDSSRPLKILSNVLSDRASSIFYVRRCAIFIG